MIESTRLTVMANPANAEVNALSSPRDSETAVQPTDSKGEKFQETFNSHLHELTGNEDTVLPETMLAAQQLLPEGKELPPLAPTTLPTATELPGLGDVDAELQMEAEDGAIITALPLILQAQVANEPQSETRFVKVSTPARQQPQITIPVAKNIQSDQLLSTETDATTVKSDFTINSIEVMKSTLQKSEPSPDSGAIVNTTTNPRLTPMAPLNSAAGTIKLSLDVPLQQGQWADNLAGRVSWMAMNNQHSAQISLNPAELGPIEVKVSLNHDQASVNFFAHNHMVRDAIQDAFPKLQHMMNENGLNLSQSSVSDQSFSQRQADAGAGQQEHLHYPFEETTEADAGPIGRVIISKPGLVDQFV